LVREVNERKARDVNGNAAESEVQNLALHRHEIGETPRRRPFGQAVEMAGADSRAGGPSERCWRLG
jgi:hypothetical protein